MIGKENNDTLLPVYIEDSYVESYLKNMFNNLDSSYYFRRFDHNGTRFYYQVRKNDNGNYSVNWYRGVTSIIGNAITQSELDSLMNWAAEMGDNFHKARNYPAWFGTIMHELAGRYFIALRSGSDNEKIYHDLDETNRYIDDIIVDNNWNVPQEIRDRWYGRARHNMLCIKRFCDEHNVSVIAIELPVVHEDWHVAGTIDAVVKMEIEVKGYFGEVYKTGERKGEPKETKIKKEITAIVDFKFPSGNSIYHKYAVQLEFYKQILESKFDISIDKIYNLRPMNNSKTYNFDLVDQTDVVSFNEMQALLMLADIRMPYPEFDMEIQSGLMAPGVSIEDLTSKITIEEYLIKKYQN
jgi:hypothetical protein